LLQPAFSRLLLLCSGLAPSFRLLSKDLGE
jgi:hypothetical protein